MGESARKLDFVGDLAEKLRFDDTTLPTMPEAVQHIRRSLNGDGVNIEKLSQIILNDPVLATRIVRAGNSAVYRTVQPVECVADAVMRMGLKQTQNVALVLLQNSFKAKHKLIENRISWLWAESLHVAAIAYVLADYYEYINTDRAVLGALLSNVGALLLLTIVDDKLTEISNETILDVMIKQYAGEFGGKLLSHWDLDAELIDVAQNLNNWSRAHDGSPDLVDLVLVAKSCRRYDFPIDYGLPAHNMLPATRKIQSTFPRSFDLPELIERSSGQIEAMRNMLSA